MLLWLIPCLYTRWQHMRSRHQPLKNWNCVSYGDLEFSEPVICSDRESNPGRLRGSPEGYNHSASNTLYVILIPDEEWMSLEIYWKKKMILLFLFRLLFKDLDTLLKVSNLMISCDLFSYLFVWLEERCVSWWLLHRKMPLISKAYTMLIDVLLPPILKLLSFHKHCTSMTAYDIVTCKGTFNLWVKSEVRMNVDRMDRVGTEYSTVTVNTGLAFPLN